MHEKTAVSRFSGTSLTVSVDKLCIFFILNLSTSIFSRHFYEVSLNLHGSMRRKFVFEDKISIINTYWFFFKEKSFAKIEVERTHNTLLLKEEFPNVGLFLVQYSKSAIDDYSVLCQIVFSIQQINFY